MAAPVEEEENYLYRVPVGLPWPAPGPEGGVMGGAPAPGPEVGMMGGAPAPEPVSAEGGAVAPEPPPSLLAFPSGDEFVSSCANSSSPICYNTSISGANIITNLWFSSILGLICYLLFVLFRGKFRLYQARLSMPTVTHKPPALRLKGLYRWWSWIIPVFRVSDEELLKSAGMDALIAVRILSFGILVLLPITIAAMAILIPINYTDNYYKKSSQQAGLKDEYSTVFIRLTMSNITPGSSVLWVHFVFVYAAVFWTCWLITEQYKEYISLRQAYIVRGTEVPASAIGGSAEAFERERQPLIASRPSGAWRDDKKEQRGGVTPRRKSLEFIERTKTLSLMEQHTPLRILHGAGSARNDSIGAGSLSFNFQNDSSSGKDVGDSNQNVSSLSGCTTLSGSVSEDVQSAGTSRKAACTAQQCDSSPAEQQSETWTNHDFSLDVMEETQQDTPIARKPAVFAGMFEEVEQPVEAPGETADLPSHRRAKSAAVMTALATDRSSAATALAKIRHHRAVSGASSLSAASGATPNSKTPCDTPRAADSPSLDQILEKKTPNGLSEIITVVAEEKDRSGTFHGDSELATCVALNPELCDPIGQLGISHHWWSYMAEAGSGKLNNEKDIKKAFVDPNLTVLHTRRSDSMRETSTSVPVNACLYTVLVTDEPIEKLRLKKPLKTREFWGIQLTKSQTKVSDETYEEGDDVERKIACEKKSTNVLATSASFPEDIEQGRGRKDEDSIAAAGESGSREVPSQYGSERGMGITAGWSSTMTNLREWWRHRGRYKEWRRDVRWAMFHRRARIATKMFTELFGDDFDGLIPIYPAKSVDKLIKKWDKVCARLERAQYDLQCIVNKEEEQRLQNSPDEEGTRDENTTCVCINSVEREKKRRQKISALKKKISALKIETIDLQEMIADEREAILSDLPSTCFFATFKSQEAAAIAAQANLNPIKQRLLNVQPAPSPDDVNWPSLTRSWWQRQSRPVLTLPLILFIMLLPIGAFTGAFAQLTIAVCGNLDDDNAFSDSWYCSDDPWANFFRNLVTSLAPTLLLSLYHMCILPVLVYYAAQAEGQHFSLSGLDRRCCSLFYYWDVFNVFLGAMLGGSVIAELPTYIQNPSSIWDALSAAIPASSNFFINYVSYRALVMAWFRLLYPHMGTTVSFLKWAHILPWAKSAREKALESPIRNCRYGRDIGIPVLMNFVMVMAYCVVSPLILPFGLLYFVLLWAVWRYQMLYVYQRQYESGGQFWPLVAHRVVGCLFICVLFTSIVLILKEAYTQAALMLVSLPLYLLRFDMYISNRYDAVVAQVPLMAVHKAGRVDTVDPSIWTPPPLREGAEGWNPEYCKVWQWWGIPRYTI